MCTANAVSFLKNVPIPLQPLRSYNHPFFVDDNRNPILLFAAFAPLHDIILLSLRNPHPEQHEQNKPHKPFLPNIQTLKLLQTLKLFKKIKTI
jgi:hypothetical protein